MYKIILAYCLVAVAVAEGLQLDDGKIYGASALTEVEVDINLEQRKYQDIVKNYYSRVSDSTQDLNKKIKKLGRVISEIPSRPCQYKFERPIKLDAHCFYPNGIFCKSVMREYIGEAIMKIVHLWKEARKTKDELVEFIEKLKYEYADCRKLLAISAAKYNECVADVKSRGNDFVTKNQMKFNSQMDIEVQKQKELLDALEKSVMLYKSNQTGI